MLWELSDLLHMASYGSSIFKEPPYSLAQSYIPTNRVEGFPFLHLLQHVFFVRQFDIGHSDLCEVILHCIFYLSGN